MKLPLFRKYRTLFVTQSGIPVRQELPVLPKENVLIRYNQTGQVLLNNRHITDAAFRRLLHIIDYYHPNAWKRADVHQTVVIYPKLVVD